MAVTSAENTSLKSPILKATREFTLERNSMGVIIVENTSLKCPALKHTRKFTLMIKHLILMCVEKLLDNQYIQKYTWLHTLDFLVVMWKEFYYLIQAVKNVMSIHI